MHTEVFFIRHQAAGVIWQTPFAQPPTVQQFEAIRTHVERTTGRVHPKTGEVFWLKVVAVRVLEPSDTIESAPPKEPSSGDGARADVPRVTASVAMTVEPPQAAATVSDEETV